MVRKSQARGAHVNWEEVERLTERKRTYEITLKSGGIIFKYYKPSEMKRLREIHYPESAGWISTKLVGRLP